MPKLDGTDAVAAGGTVASRAGSARPPDDRSRGSGPRLVELVASMGSTMPPERGASGVVPGLTHRPGSQSKPTLAGAACPHHAQKAAILEYLAQTARWPRSGCVNFLSTTSTHLENPPTRTVLSGPFHLAKDSGYSLSRTKQLCILAESV